MDTGHLANNARVSARQGAMRIVRVQEVRTGRVLWQAYLFAVGATCAVLVMMPGAFDTPCGLHVGGDNVLVALQCCDVSF